MNVKKILKGICSKDRPYKGAKMAKQIEDFGYKTSWAKSDDGMSARFDFVHFSTARANRTRGN